MKPELQNTMYEIRLQMWSKGGNFVRELSRAMGAADLENQARAVAAWPEIFERYDALATVAKQQQPELIQ